MGLRCLFITGLGLAAVEPAWGQPAAVPPSCATSAFRQFVGACQGGPLVPNLCDLVGWDRNDVYWSRLEPKPGDWKQEELERVGQRVLALQAKGMKFLPILCYNTQWSLDRAERTYELGDCRVHVQPVANGNYRVEKSHRSHDGVWCVDAVNEEPPGDHWPLAAECQGAWENYVRRTVAFLRQPPYNVQYFQIWNEAYPTSGFWDGDLDAYMKRVHLPAAKIIRELGGKVVYGGWPCCGSVQDYVALLDRYKAWESIDVLDVHYFPLSAFEYLYKAAGERGHKSMGIWQTEIAFSKDPGFVGNTLPRFLSWCLAHNWSYPDRYRLFFFCAETPDDPASFGYERALVQGQDLSWHGLSMKTLGDAFSSGQLKLYSEVASKPMLKSEIDESKSSLEAFKVGDKRIVLAVHLVENNDAKVFTDWNGSLGSIHLDADNPMLRLEFRKLAPAQIVSAERVDMAGNRQPLAPGVSESGAVKLELPIRDAEQSQARTWYRRSRVINFLVQISTK